MIDIENMKYIVEQEIKSRHFESLHYVLFDEDKRLPWAFHLYQKNGKFSEKEYRFLRVDRRGRISIIARGDSDELKFSSLEFKVL